MNSLSFSCRALPSNRHKSWASPHLPLFLVRGLQRASSWLVVESIIELIQYPWAYINPSHVTRQWKNRRTQLVLHPESMYLSSVVSWPALNDSKLGSAASTHSIYTKICRYGYHHTFITYDSIKKACYIITWSLSIYNFSASTLRNQEIKKAHSSSYKSAFWVFSATFPGANLHLPAILIPCIGHVP